MSFSDRTHRQLQSASIPPCPPFYEKGGGYKGIFKFSEFENILKRKEARGMAMGNKGLREHARELRKNSTPQEIRLWSAFLKHQPVQFYRQKVMGNYIVDFYCPKLKLVIELDGSQHFEPENEEYDRQRTAYLKRNFDVEVIRFDNHQMNTNFEGVCNYLLDIINAKLPCGGA